MPKPPNTVWAAILLSAGGAAYVLQDLILKIVSGDYPLHQALVIRAITAVPLAIALVYAAGSQKSIRGSTRPMMPRSALTVTSNLTYYLAVATLPLATVGALYQSAPLIITALSVIILQERVNAMQWAAVAAGFAGVVLIIHPGAGAFEWATLLPLLSALSYAGAAIFVRKSASKEDSSVMALQTQIWLSLSGAALALVLGFGELNWEIQKHPSMDFLLRGWAWPSVEDLAVLLACGVTGAISTFLLAKAYTKATASRLAPFEYTSLLWSVILGWMVWGHLPSLKDWIGIALLVVAGLVSVYMAESPPEEAQSET